MKNNDLLVTIHITEINVAILQKQYSYLCILNCSIVQGMDGEQGPPGDVGPIVSDNLQMIGSCM